MDNYTTFIIGYDISNTYTPDKTSVTVRKVLEDADNQDGIRPKKVTAELYADGKKVNSAELTSTDNWEYIFADLPKYGNGKKITYTVTETPVEGYRSSVNGNELTGFMVRNTLRPQTPTTNDKEPTIKPATPTTTMRRPQTPFTSDTSNVALYGGLTLVALATVLGILIRRSDNG